jgi:excisionase family DNA binding protein
MLSPIAYSIRGAAEATGLSKTSIYDLLSQGKLRAVKHGKRTLILERDLRQWSEGLPSVAQARAAA